MAKTIERSELQEIISWYKENFPKAFPARVSEIKPLQLGIMDEIMAFYDRMSYPPFSKKKLRAALNFYTSSPAYLKAQQPGAMRVDLFGFEVEPVQPEQAQYAQDKLQNYIDVKQKNKSDKLDAETQNDESSTGQTKS
jgi:ProP effector